jgi:hypothetical protein
MSRFRMERTWNPLRRWHGSVLVPSQHGEGAGTEIRGRYSRLARGQLCSPLQCSALASGCVEGGKLQQQNNLFARPTAGPKQARRNWNNQGMQNPPSKRSTQDPQTPGHMSAVLPHPCNCNLSLQSFASSFFPPPACVTPLIRSAHLPKPPSGGEHDVHEPAC